MIVEAKDNKHTIGAGLRQALDYSHILDIPFVFSSNGDGFKFHGKTATDSGIETDLDNGSFPAPDALWEKYKKYKGIETPEEKTIGNRTTRRRIGEKPRYYQQHAINGTIEAIAKGHTESCS